MYSVVKLCYSSSNLPIEHLNKFCEYFNCGLNGIIEYIKDENEK
ncbi:helix-turn-helix domain-containing protein [Clostridium sp.]